MTSRVARWATAAVAAALLATGLLLLDDVGTTWDEPESYDAGIANLRLIADAFAGRDLVWPWHELRGYQFVFDTLRAVVAVPANAVFWEAGAVEGFHLANLLLATASLLLTGSLARAVSGDPATGPLAAATLALTPKFLAHSQANPKDLIGLFVILLAVRAIVFAAARPGTRSTIAAAAAIGLAGANHVASIVLAPIAALWLLAAGRGSWRERIVRLATIGFGAIVVAFLAWPWLWGAPATRLGELVERVRTFPVGMGVLYLGTIYPRADPPAHYSLVSLAVTTPLLLAGLLAWGGLRGVRGAPGERRLAALAGLWAGALLGIEAFAAAHYDGVRHVLPVLVPLALLAGLGAAAALRWSGAAWRRGRRGLAGATAGLALAGLVSLGVDLVRLDPYFDAYLAEPARWLVPGDASDWMELEYWGFTYKEAAAFVAAEAPPSAVVVVPMAPEIVAPYLRPDLELRPGRALTNPRLADRDRYLVLMRRPGWYDDAIRTVRASRTPVFTVGRLGSTLLEVYHLPPSGRLTGPR